jgi:hypothetical protein
MLRKNPEELRTQIQGFKNPKNIAQFFLILVKSER